MIENVRIKRFVHSDPQRGFAAPFKAIGCDQCLQRKFLEQGRSEQAHDALSDHKDAFAQDRRRIVDQIHSGFHVREEGAGFGWERHRPRRGVGSEDQGGRLSDEG